jgi:hypothetical protein
MCNERQYLHPDPEEELAIMEKTGGELKGMYRFLLDRTGRTHGQRIHQNRLTFAVGLLT